MDDAPWKEIVKGIGLALFLGGVVAPLFLWLLGKVFY